MNQSNKAIHLLRFPLILSIVAIHSDTREVEQMENLYMFSQLMDFLKIYVLFPSLYTFFFISGYLFFREKKFSWQIYLHKLKRRVHTLLIPFLLWNAIALVAIWIWQTAFPESDSLLQKRVSDFRWQDFLLIFWDKRAVTGSPSDPHSALLLPFWFVQNLMVMVVLSPIVWIVIRYLKGFFPIFLLAIYVFVDIPSYPGFNETSFLFFPLGAWYGVWIKDGNRKMWLWLFAALMLLVVKWKFNTVYDILFCFLLVALTERIISYDFKMPAWANQLSSQSFFVFAAHMFFCSVIMKILNRIAFPHNDFSATIEFVSVVLINVLLCLLVGFLLRKLSPRIYSLLTGR